MHPQYKVYEVGMHCSRWNIEDSTESIAFSTNDKYVYRGNSDDDDHIATIDERTPKNWEIEILDPKNRKIIKMQPVYRDEKFNFEYHNVCYQWQKGDGGIWDLVESKHPDKLVAQFNESSFAITKIGELFVLEKGKKLEHEVIIATLKAIYIYLEHVF
jgi:hypothetical protein